MDGGLTNIVNLYEFITRIKRFPNNAYVDEPGFISLYVRHGRRYINGVEFPNILDIANVEVEIKGKGTFTRLIERIRSEYPGIGIYVESIQNPRLPAKLEQLGFTKVEGIFPPSYYWLPSTATHKP